MADVKEQTTSGGISPRTHHPPRTISRDREISIESAFTLGRDRESSTESFLRMRDMSPDSRYRRLSVESLNSFESWKTGASFMDRAAPQTETETETDMQPQRTISAAETDMSAQDRAISVADENGQTPLGSFAMSVSPVGSPGVSPGLNLTGLHVYNLRTCVPAC